MKIIMFISIYYNLFIKFILSIYKKKMLAEHIETFTNLLTNTDISSLKHLIDSKMISELQGIAKNTEGDHHLSVGASYGGST